MIVMARRRMGGFVASGGPTHRIRGVRIELLRRVPLPLLKSPGRPHRTNPAAQPHRQACFRQRIFPMDKRALKILFDTYWSKDGWRSGARCPAEADFAFAKAQGVMFDPISPTHDESIERARAAAARLTPQAVGDAFVASLSTRRLDWRSALGSYCMARRVPTHPATDGVICNVCGLYTSGEEEDLNVYNFERLKWGGVRHAYPVYAALDLELLLREPLPSPTSEDVALLRKILAAIDSAPAGTTSAMLHRKLPASLKANKAERDALIGMLGHCGALSTAAHPGHRAGFVRYVDRATPPRHFVDMPYPVSWWKRSDGIEPSSVQEFFGHLL
ncbi:hypothetical protein [Roseateles amylovorans]|uniref:Uncharacterized protein n=1 Tax=Roseateles amylovorans TaxID=2978473 RepID=A0ABY6B757_9BURK|nr:hypothetical protein [Roseateles amylovorans]UXH80168.1 hypothetical protein N4261_09925 [Roseateles amylovorans]